ncbi:hypothetical protein B0H14DRAFT_2568733 [Mycena olivaceomarginata]|nr:hypothetical protein B0H14DRAFT_2568733 [Mycena olivaceomarginata]
MVQISRVFAILTVVSVGLAASVKRSDVNTIVSKVAVLNTKIIAFCNTPTLPAAGNIEIACQDLRTSLVVASGDTKNCPQLNDADTTTILNPLQTLGPIIASALKQLVTCGPKILALPGNLKPLVCETLNGITSDTKTFATLLQAKCSANQQAKATGIKNGILSAADSANAFYCH